MRVRDVSGGTPLAIQPSNSKETSAKTQTNGQALTANHWRGLILVALVLGVAWINLSRISVADDALDKSIQAPMIGFLAPDFTLADVDGQTVQLSTLRGTPVVLNFWTTWCPPCSAEMPALEALWQRHNRGGVVVLGVNEGESAAVVKLFASGTVKTTFPLVLDTHREAGTRYGVRTFPSTFFVDEDGRIQDIKVGGPLNAASLAGSVEKIVH